MKLELRGLTISTAAVILLLLCAPCRGESLYDTVRGAVKSTVQQVRDTVTQSSVHKGRRDRSQGKETEPLM